MVHELLQGSPGDEPAGPDLHRPELPGPQQLVDRRPAQRQRLGRLRDGAEQHPVVASRRILASLLITPPGGEVFGRPSTSRATCPASTALAMSPATWPLWPPRPWSQIWTAET